jgi:hypothetical protein
MAFHGAVLFPWGSIRGSLNSVKVKLPRGTPQAIAKESKVEKDTKWVIHPIFFCH